jgi:O-antigen/teichoic acid export membrane protein
MNTVKRLVKNTGAVLLAQVAEPACSFILVLFIARSLGVSGLGKFSIVISLYFIFQTISSLGFSHLITREVARDRSRAGKYLINASFIGFFFSVLMAGAMCLTGYLLNYSADTSLSIYVLSFSLIPGALALVCQSICTAFEKLEYVSIPLIMGNLFKVLLGLLILFKGYGLVELMAVILGSHFLTMFMSSYFVLRCIGKPLFRIDFGFCKWIVETTPTFALIFIFATIYWNVDILMLSKIKGPTEVGFYSAAYKLMNVWKIIPVGYLMALQPIISRLFESSLEKFRIACTSSIRYLFIVMLPIAVGSTLLSDDIILLFFKRGFLASANALSILVWALVPYAINMTLSHALIASNNQKTNLRSLLISMMSNVALNLLLIPKFSFLGAAMATLASICIFLGLQYSFVSKNLFNLNFLQIAGKPVVSAALMAIVILLFRQINLFLLIFISALAYVVFLLPLKTFSQTDIRLLRRLWGKEEGLAILQSQGSGVHNPSKQ